MPGASLVLTVDVEEWFHVCGHPTYDNPERWESFPSRVVPSTERILGLLERASSHATFFVLGWVARRHPGLIRRIAESGHEVGCHGDLHRRADTMTEQEFRADLRAARASLEEAGGVRVMSYRAPEWSLRSTASPHLPTLVEEGFRVDSSLQAVPPIGDIGNPRKPTVLTTPAGDVLEVPPLVGTLFGFPAMLGGGWTSRFSREARVTAAVEAALARGESPVLYVHPWEVDEEHPPMELSPIARLVHFGARGRVVPRLTRLLSRHRSVSLAEAFPAGSVRREAAA
ncbi:MAG TPA: polysaccharide deacetylase family protein [Thermoanaerobaculia bacterium]|nr:polysaccharide deacetylase family protein [Thermoanaerobaculia bacterium]